MTLSDRTLTSELPTRKLMKKLTVYDTTTHCNKSTINTQKIKVNPYQHERNHFIGKKTHIYGRNDERGDFRLRMTKKKKNHPSCLTKKGLKERTNEMKIKAFREEKNNFFYKIHVNR